MALIDLSPFVYNSNVVGDFIANCRALVSLTGSHPPLSLAAHNVVHPGARHYV